MRIRAEGALEVLEGAARSYEQLSIALERPGWAEHLANLDLLTLEQAIGRARKTVVLRLEHDVLGEGQQALASVNDARQRFRQAVLERAAQVGVATNGKLSDVIARLRRKFPLRLETEVVDLGHPRGLGLGALITRGGSVGALLLVAQVVVMGLLHVLDNPRKESHLVFAYAVASAIVSLAGLTSPTLRASITRALRFPAAPGAKCIFTVGNSAFAYQGQRIRLSQVNAVDLSLTETGQSKLTIRLTQGRVLRLLTDDAVALHRALKTKKAPSPEPFFTSWKSKNYQR